MAQALRLRLFGDINNGLLLTDLAVDLQIRDRRSRQQFQDFTTPTLGTQEPSVACLYFTTLFLIIQLFFISFLRTPRLLYTTPSQN